MPEHKYYLGKVDYNKIGRRDCPCYITWELKDGRFSMSAEVWQANRLDIYEGGQCVDRVAGYFPNNKKAQRMVAIWERWHLNDMRASCEHQRGPEWEPQPIELKKFTIEWELESKLTDDATAIAQQHGAPFNAKDRASLQRNAPFNPPAEQLLLLHDFNLRPFEWVALDEAKLESEARKLTRQADFEQIRRHIKSKTESANTSWLRPTEHPQGFLMKACPTCGYHYGSEWRKEALPPEVEAEIRSWSTPEPAQGVA